MAIIDVSIVPVGTSSTSLSKFVASALKILEKEKNIKYELTSMGTNIEGDLDNILGIAKKMHRSAFSDKVKRVVTVIKIDDRIDKPSSIKGKIESVKDKLRG